ncbi:MAG: 4Fe-4S dicluster domain-containing protein [Magnetococcales bacterium]|nr:4Fe-4S dicluster domain-containing protein [Magnetococcales bacterium]
MSAFFVHKEAVTQWIRHLARSNTVYFPQRAGQSGFRFKPVKETTEIQFDRYQPTLAPPGKKLAPAEEPLFRYRKQGDAAPELVPILDQSPRILAGVRPCDLKGIHLMDRANREGHGDPHYLTRRTHTILIAHDCLQPCDDSCFCDAVGSLGWRDNADLFLTSLEDHILIEVRTGPGETLIQGMNFPVCTDVAAVKSRAEAQRAQPFGRQFHADLARIPAIIASQWQAPVWEKQVERCFSCGSCNLVCPTCYCFDVHDDFDLTDPNAGQRTRTWDGCMLPQFAEVAGGHNFRPNPAARQRHRVKRKFEYLTERFAEGSFCTGCGRCGRQCTTDIDIFNIVNDLIDHAEANS